MCIRDSREPEHDVRQRRVRPDQRDARQPVVRPLRHDGAEHPDRVQDQVLVTVRGSREAPPLGYDKRAGRREAPGPSCVCVGPHVQTADAWRRRGIPSGLRFRKPASRAPVTVGRASASGRRCRRRTKRSRLRATGRRSDLRASCVTDAATACSTVALQERLAAVPKRPREGAQVGLASARIQ